jgi:hypothetical protein
LQVVRDQLAASVVSSSSLVLVHVASTWSGYSFPGYLFASNACLMLYAYLRLLCPRGKG